MDGVKGYKVFNHNWTCSPNGNTKQYTCPGKFEEDITPVSCGHGMHFCRKASDCFNYYTFNMENKVAEVIAYGDVVEEGDKCCTNKLEIVREIPWQELLTMVNTGKGCTGLSNTGDSNTGDSNTGHRNTGNWNTGDSNTGDRNTGNWNTGDWNKSSFNNGCFNTLEPKIMLFNKPSDMTYRNWLNSDARYLLSLVQKNVVEWIWSDNMTDKEKEQHPEYKTTGGYLKVLDESECCQIWWDSLTDDKKNIIKSIPNFDAEIFKQCTGIDVESEIE